MIGTVRRARLPWALAVGVAVGAAVVGSLAGCAGDGSGGRAAASGTSGSAAATSGSVTGSTLTEGLLPADTFGIQATVVPVTLEQLRQSTSSLGGAAMAGLEVEPPACAVAVQGTAPNYTKVDDLAAQSAISPTGTTVEALMTGSATKGAVERLRGSAAACPQATVAGPQSGTVTMTFQMVPIIERGDDAGALLLTTTVAKPDGTSTSVPTLMAAIEDHGRLLLLAESGTNGTVPDEAAFTALLDKAYTTQAHAFD
jgi:hypothetical protein